MRVGVGAGRGRQGMCSGMRWWSVEWQSVREQQCGACVILCMQLHANIDLGGQQQCPAHFLGCCGRYPGGWGAAWVAFSKMCAGGFHCAREAPAKTRYSGHHFSRLMRDASNKRQAERPAYLMRES